jgi:hypothetical protein
MKQGDRLLLALAIAMLPLFAACSSSATSPSRPAPTRMYLTNGSSVPGGGATSFYALPISSTSVSSGGITTTTYPWFECTDGTGRLFSVSYGAGTLLAFTQPIANAATAAFTINLTVPNSPIDCVFDSAGNLYISESTNNRIAVIPGPITASSVPNATYITASVSSPFGVAVDTSGDLFVCNSTNITEYSPLGGGNALLHTFGSVHNNEGCIIGPDGSLYVANGTSQGEIDVYKPPFTNASAVDHAITVPGSLGIYEMEFDAAGTMYVSGNASAQSDVWVFAPPYTAPSATLVVNAGIDHAVGLALTQ